MYSAKNKKNISTVCADDVNLGKREKIDEIAADIEENILKQISKDLREWSDSENENKSKKEEKVQKAFTSLEILIKPILINDRTVILEKFSSKEWCAIFSHRKYLREFTHIVRECYKNGNVLGLYQFLYWSKKFPELYDYLIPRAYSWLKTIPNPHRGEWTVKNLKWILNDLTRNE